MTLNDTEIARKLAGEMSSLLIIRCRGCGKVLMDQAGLGFELFARDLMRLGWYPDDVRGVNCPECRDDEGESR